MALNLDLAAVNDGGLTARSVDLLREGQHESGAFVACPDFPVYGFAWLRDGSFCARALDGVGHHDAARQFHCWAERTVLTHAATAERAIVLLGQGIIPGPGEMLPTRYDLNGNLEQPGAVDDAPWPNFQLDGYGIWLHELETHIARTGWTGFDRRAVDLVARYLTASWRIDCNDCWEEFGEGQHTSTLASVAAGLAAAGRLLRTETFTREADRVRATLLATCVRDGYLRKGPTDDRVDASLLWVAVPLGVLEIDDPVMVGTVEEIQKQLTRTAGGVYRYIGDTYYGGGEWVLLTCWLAWYYARTSNHEGFELALRWVRAQANEDGLLPEQVAVWAQDHTMIEPWVGRWGPVATPLLWSHAMYLIASEASQ